MRGRRAVEIGLAVGAALGLFWRGSIVRAPAPQLDVRAEHGHWVPFGAPREARVLGHILDASVRREVSHLPLRDQCFGQDYCGAILERVSLRGRDLRHADFTDATLRAVDFTDAKLAGAGFEGAAYDRFCRWPVGFDPSLHGATLNHWPAP